MGFNIGGFLNAVGDVFSSTGSKGSPLFAAIGAGAKIASGALGKSPPGRATAPVPNIQTLGRPSQTGPVSVQNVSRGFNLSEGRGFSAGGVNVASLAPVIRGLGTGAVGLGLGEGISRMFGGNGSVSEILKEARENVGHGVTKNKIIDAAKTCGIELAANTFGLNESQVCLVIVAGRTRRSRGISAADIRRTKRVIRFNKRLTKDLKSR